MRECKKCNVEQPIDNFQKVGSEVWRWTCKSCRSGIESERKMIKRYGINASEKELMLEKQGSVCAICGSDSPKHSYGWATDHCHDDGHVRGILCQPCNLAIGAMQSLANAGLLNRAFEYVGMVEWTNYSEEF